MPFNPLDDELAHGISSYVIGRLTFFPIQIGCPVGSVNNDGNPTNVVVLIIMYLVHHPKG